jgi:predicted ribosomally synthesized peptide with SipW-like signal peptide
MNPIYIVGIAICVVLFTVIVATFASLSQKDTANNTKLLSIIIAFSVAVSLFAYGLALYYFSRNPDFLLQFLLATVMLVLLPGTLIGTSVAAVTVSNLRDVVANS